MERDPDGPDKRDDDADLWPRKPQKRRRAKFRYLDELEAKSREHGGVPVFRTLDDPDDDRVLPTMLHIRQGTGEGKHLLTIEIGGDDANPGVRAVVTREHFEALMEDYLDAGPELTVPESGG